METIAKILRGPNVGGSVDESLHVGVVAETEEESREKVKSTPVKVVSGVSNVAEKMRFPNESPLKHSLGVASVINDEEELISEVKQSGKKRESNDGGGRMAASTGGLTTEIGLSELDDMVAMGPSTSPANAPLFGEPCLGIELSPREELVNGEKFPNGVNIIQVSLPRFY